MDWTTFGASLGSSLLGGGLIGGLVSLKIAKDESTHRESALDLEREKVGYERKAAYRADARGVLSEIAAILDQMDRHLVEINRSRHEKAWTQSVAQDVAEASFALRSRLSNALVRLIPVTSAEVLATEPVFTLTDLLILTSESFARTAGAIVEASELDVENGRAEFIDLSGDAETKIAMLLGTIH
jgi:hypothetical protein